MDRRGKTDTGEREIGRAQTYGEGEQTEGQKAEVWEKRVLNPSTVFMWGMYD